MKYLITLPALLAVLMTLTLVTAANARTERHAVDTVVAGIPVRTSVDSAAAKALLEAPTQDSECHTRSDVPDAQTLAAISREQSTDTATAVLIRCLQNIPEVARAQQLFLDNLTMGATGLESLAPRLAPHASNYLLLFVPGWGYRSSGEVTGSGPETPARADERAGL